MSESGDYSPGVWSGHDFGAARAAYDQHVGRGYADAQAQGVKPSDLVPDSISTKSTCPQVILTDTSGSMADWPSTIFSKLPYLEHEAKTEYFSDDVEFCFGAFADVYDRYTMQMRPFAKGTDIAARMKELVPSGGGSGPETYREAGDLGLLYLCRKMKMPKAVRPVLIIISDEHLKKFVDHAFAKSVAGVDIGSESLSIEQLFVELTTKFSVYFIQKPYDHGSTSEHLDEVSRTVREQWVGLLGEDRVAFLPEAGRVVDVIFGLWAKEVGRVDYFRKEIEARQNKAQVKTVYKALNTVLAVGGPSKPAQKQLPAPGKSVMLGGAKSGGKKTKKLI